MALHVTQSKKIASNYPSSLANEPEKKKIAPTPNQIATRIAPRNQFSDTNVSLIARSFPLIACVPTPEGRLCRTSPVPTLFRGSGS
jgi:hypothetical protein